MSSDEALKQLNLNARRSAVLKLLETLDDKETREGLVETPERVAQAWEHWTSGYGQNPADVLKTFEDGAEGYDEMIFQGTIPVYSHCEHHLAAFWGVAHIGYLPDGRIVGLSKLARVVDIFARRLQVQERLTAQIAEALEIHLGPRGVGVVLQCRHMCMESRGVQKPGTITYTSSLRGQMRSSAGLRNEFLTFVKLASHGLPV